MEQPRLRDSGDSNGGHCGSTPCMQIAGVLHLTHCCPTHSLKPYLPASPNVDAYTRTY